MKLLVWIGLYLLFLTNSPAKALISDYVLGQQHKLESKTLKESVEIDIFQPETPEVNLPVLLLLDSQRHFPQAVAIQQHTTEYELAPAYLVVGIRTTDDSRGRWYYSQRQAFLTFLKTELFPYLKQHHPVGTKRLLFGWELGGGLVLSAMTTQPDLFDAYIAASPTPIYGSYFPQAQADFDAFEAQLKTRNLQDKFFYVSQSRHDFPVQYGMENLLQLKKKHPKKLQWQYQQWQHVTHSETGFPTLLDGIKKYFHNYPQLRISESGLHDFLQSGGIKTITPYYQSRSQRFGFSAEATAQATQASHLSLVIQAISEDNYPVFADFMQAFYPQVQALEQAHPNQVFNIAMFYLKYQQTDQSLELLDYLATKHPESPRPINGKGDVYRALGKARQAREHYQQAIQMAQQSGHWRLPEFVLDLQNLDRQE